MTTTIHRRRGRRGSPDGKPNPIDIHVGSRVKLRRTLLGMSQEKLGEAIGLTFQQVQKYERGANRIGASRLFELSKVLDVPVSFFFDDMADTPLVVAGPSAGSSRELLELSRSLSQLPETVQTAVRGLCRAVAQEKNKCTS